MKNAYKGILGVIFVLATMGGISCVDVNNSTSGSVTTTPVVGSGNIVEESTQCDRGNRRGLAKRR